MDKSDRDKNIPTVEEFNRKMHEYVEYEKLNKLKEHLKETINWFGNNIGGVDIGKLYGAVCSRMKEIPEESINFNIEVHGETTNL